jgi:hypothetical protein
MKTEASGDVVRTTIAGIKLRSVIASVDDYLMNLAIADETCRYLQENKTIGTGTVRGQHKTR